MDLIRQGVMALVLAWLSATALASEPIVNYRQYSATLASAGQPTAAQIESVAADGFKRIVYLAFGDHQTSLANEDRIARDNGLQFVQIPVVWKQPSIADYELFSAVMTQGSEQPTLVHCQINWRASSFVFLYRVLELGVPIAEAKADLNAVWAPEPTWRQFIFDTLASRGVSPDCDVCDWSLPE